MYHSVAGDLHIWNRHSGALYRQLKLFDKEKNKILKVGSITYDPGLDVYAVGYSNGQIELWKSE